MSASLLLAVSSGKRCQYVDVGSVAASVPPTFPPETANTSDFSAPVIKVM